MKNRDTIILIKMSEYADNISNTITALGLDRRKFLDHLLAKTSISMWIQQIGELAKNLTDGFRETHKAVPWRDIVAIRNRAAHAYETINWNYLWQIANDNIPELKAFCERILQQTGSNGQ